MENADLFYGSMKNANLVNGGSEYFTAIWYHLYPFGIFCGHLVHFPHFGMLYQEKSGNPVAPRVFTSIVNAPVATVL
jgi:hypothetical protein